MGSDDTELSAAATAVVRDVLVAHLLRGVGDMVVVLDREGRIVLTNAAIEDALGCPSAELLGAHWDRFVVPDDVDLSRAALAAAPLVDTPPGRPVDIRLRRCDGASCEVRAWTYHAIRRHGTSTPDPQEGAGDSSGHDCPIADHLVVVLQDRSPESAERRRSRALERALEHRERHDAVTGLPLRGELVRLADEQAAQRAVARGRRSVVTVRFTPPDLPGGGLGSGEVDEVVRQVATSIQRLLADDDVLARGQFGELIALTGVRDHHGAGVALAQRIIDDLRVGVVLGDRAVGVELNVGVADADADGDILELIGQSTVAAGWAGRRTGTAIECYTAERGWGEISASRLRDRVREVMAADRMELHLQPIVDTASLHVVGVEALLRWPGTDLPDAGTVFALAAQDDLAIEIDRHVLRLAMRAIADLEYEFGDDCPVVTVNLNPRTLADAAYFEQLDHLLDAHALRPSLLCFEITEQIELDADPAVSARLAALQRRGVKLAIDDFGDGYSSLALLNRINADIVKIDGTLVRDVVTDQRVADLVASAIGIGRAIGATVVAEGVETLEQRLWLRQVGCPLVQGYLVSRPIRVADAVDFVRLANHGDVPPPDRRRPGPRSVEVIAAPGIRLGVYVTATA